MKKQISTIISIQKAQARAIECCKDYALWPGKNADRELGEALAALDALKEEK